MQPQPGRAEAIYVPAASESFSAWRTSGTIWRAIIDPASPRDGDEMIGELGYVTWVCSKYRVPFSCHDYRAIFFSLFFPRAGGLLFPRSLMLSNEGSLVEKNWAELYACAFQAVIRAISVYTGACNQVEMSRSPPRPISHTVVYDRGNGCADDLHGLTVVNGVTIPFNGYLDAL